MSERKSKRKAFVHIGLDDASGDRIGPSLDFHRHALAELGVSDPAHCDDEMFRAALEILGAHKAWGFKRREVEGAWSAVYRRAHQGRDTVVVSQPLLAAATRDQAALLVDGLAGLEVHVVVTVRAPDSWTLLGDAGRDLGGMLDRWQHAVRRPERLHVIVVDPDDADAEWRALGRVVGFGTRSLAPVESRTAPRPPHLTAAARQTSLETLGRAWADLLERSEFDVVGDPAHLVPRGSRRPEAGALDVVTATERALDTALADIERLSRRNTSLELRIAHLERKKAKLKRRLTSVA